MLTAAGAALGAVACGGDHPVEVDHSIVETAIATSVARQQHLLSIVACPTGVDAVKGKRFRCLATLASGRQVPVTVTVRGADGTVDFSGFEGFEDGRPAAP